MQIASRFIDVLGEIILCCSKSRTFFFVAAIIWILFGFAIDGTSEPGHHGALILGGACVGAGLARSSR